MSPFDFSEQELQELTTIRERYKIDLTRFFNGIMFVQLILNGETRTASYQSSFGGTSYEARTNATSLWNTRWIQELVEFRRVQHDIDAIEDIQMLKEEARGMILGDGDTEPEPKDKIAAMRLLKDLSEQKKTQEEVEQEKESAAITILGKLLDISQQGKMIGRGGKLIDAEIIE